MVADYALLPTLWMLTATVTTIMAQSKEVLQTKLTVFLSKPIFRPPKDLGLKDKDGNDIDWGVDSTAAKRGLADRFMSDICTSFFIARR